MLNLNKLKKLFLFSLLFTLGISNYSKAEVQTELNSLVENIGELTKNINTVIQEFEKINDAQLKKAFVVGIIKNFPGDISFTEIQALSSLGNNFSEKTPIEILEFTTELISNKSNNEQTKVKIKGIKDQIDQTFKINIKTTQTTTSNFNTIKEHPTIQKIINASKKNPEKLKKLLDYIVETSLSTSSSVKDYFKNIIDKIENLF